MNTSGPAVFCLVIIVTIGLLRSLLVVSSAQDKNVVTVKEKAVREDERFPYFLPSNCSLGGPCLGFAGTKASQSTCVKFSPMRYLEYQDAAGKSYLADYRSHYEQVYNFFNPFIFIDRMDEERTTSCPLPRMLSYFHIRKCGGTTMSQALKKSLRPEFPYDQPQVYFFRERNRLGHDNVYKIWNATMRRAYRYQQEANLADGNLEDQAVIFTFVRDPVARFLSAVGELLHEGIYGRYFPDCPSRTLSTVDLLKCVLQTMKNEKSYLNVHLSPQIFNMRDRVGDYDLEIILMDLVLMDDVLATLLGVEQGSVRARDSRVSKYAKNHQMRLSVLTEDMIRDICRLYQVDLLLFRETSVTTSICDQYEWTE